MSSPMNQLKDSANRVPFGGRARPVPFRAKPSLDLGPPKPKSRAGRRGKTHIPLCISILVFFHPECWHDTNLPHSNGWVQQAVHRRRAVEVCRTLTWWQRWCRGWGRCVTISLSTKSILRSSLFMFFLHLYFLSSSSFFLSFFLLQFRTPIEVNSRLCSSNARIIFQY